VIVEYKRLTNQEWSKDIDLTQELGYSYIYKRLYELEEKIENGTLVTVPYTIGQEVYWVDKKGYFDVEKVKVSLITIRHDGSVDIRLNHYRTGGNYSGCFKYDPKHDELFDSEAEAEKRLEELRNGK
jgi:hypothetical protein